MTYRGVSPARYTAALAGDMPGEALASRDADRLVRNLHTRGWTCAEIAAHTRWSTYTVARKLARLQLTTQGIDAA